MVLPLLSLSSPSSTSLVYSLIRVRLEFREAGLNLDLSLLPTMTPISNLIPFIIRFSRAQGKSVGRGINLGGRVVLQTPVYLRHSLGFGIVDWIVGILRDAIVTWSSRVWGIGADVSAFAVAPQEFWKLSTDTDASFSEIYLYKICAWGGGEGGQRMTETGGRWSPEGISKYELGAAGTRGPGPNIEFVSATAVSASAIDWSHHATATVF